MPNSSSEGNWNHTNSNMGVSINGGTPKWMVYDGKNTIMDDLGVPPIYGNPHIMLLHIAQKDQQSRLVKQSAPVSQTLPYVGGINRVNHVKIYGWFVVE